MQYIPWSMHMVLWWLYQPYFVYQCWFNSSPLDKMVAILQTTFSSAFSWMNNHVFWLKFRWRLFLRVQLRSRLRDWSRSGGSYGNNTRVICCPAPGCPESAARGRSPPDNKSRGCCCRNSLPTVINPDYNMTKQRCMNVFTTKYIQNHHQI